MSGLLRTDGCELVITRAFYKLSGKQLWLLADGPEGELSLGPISLKNAEKPELAGLTWKYKGNPGRLLWGEDELALYSANVTILTATATELTAHVSIEGTDDREQSVELAGEIVFKKKRG